MVNIAVKRWWKRINLVVIWKNVIFVSYGERMANL